MTIEVLFKDHNVSMCRGDLFESKADAFVDPVNCYGVHGKGLALEFKKRWPKDIEQFTEDCKMGKIEPGSVYNACRDTGRGEQPKWLLFFPTKDHWRDHSEEEWIDKGFEDLIDLVQELKVKSIAIPALGCGLGGLPWSWVGPLMLLRAKRMFIPVEIFEPQELT